MTSSTRANRPHTIAHACAAMGLVAFICLVLATALGGPPLPEMPPDPTDAALSPVGWLQDRATQMLLAGVLFSLWGVSAFVRCLDRRARRLLACVAALITLWMLDVILKWNTSSVWASSLLWYLYYVPMTLLPPLFLALGGRAAGLDLRPQASAWSRAIWLASAAIIALVLTNNLHQQVFSFERATGGVVGEYAYEWGYWLVVAWSALCYAGFFASLAWASRRRLRVFILLVFLVFAVGLGIALGYAHRVAWVTRLNFSLVYAVLVVVALECSLDFGLLPSSASLVRVFGELPLDLKVLSREGDLAYATAVAEPLVPALRQDIARLGHAGREGKTGGARRPSGAGLTLPVPGQPNRLARLWPRAGGYALLTQDVSELNATHASLEQAHARLLRDNEMLRREHDVAATLASLEAESRLVKEVEDALASSMERVRAILEGLPAADTPAGARQRTRELRRARMILAYCKRKGSLVLSESADPEFDLERVPLIVNELASDLRAVGIDAAATVSLAHPLMAQDVSTLYDCIYDFARAAFETSDPVLIYHLGERADGVELRAVLQSSDDDDLSLREQSAALRALLDGRDVVYRLSGEVGALRLIVRIKGGGTR